jgi:membrane dipeptidase
MRRITVVLALALVSAPTYAQPSASDLSRARRILRETPLVDGHNDLAWAIRRDSTAPLDVAAYDLRKRTRGHTDLERLTKGMVGGQFWSVYVPGEVKDSGFARIQLEQIDIARRFIEMYPERFQLALDARGVRNAFRRKRIGSLIGMEGGHVLENSLGTLRAYHALGARYMTLTHNVTLDWADAASDSARHGGLTEFGKEVVREMNRLGMLVDLSHTSPGTMSDALDVAEAPVIFSHSNARALADVPRNVPDSILRRLPRNGGVVMVTFVPGFVTTVPGGATLSQVADHIEHIRRIAGADHVGIGGDFDGISVVVAGLEDVTTYPALFAELVRRGWPDSDLRKLAGENILRVMERAESAAVRLQRSRQPSVKTIQQLDAP